jgi:chaperone required for assembly of F1-ATPase
MRDIFEDIYKDGPVDPMVSAQRGARASLARRFFQQTSVAEEGGAFRILLDGKPVKTPARRMLAAPSHDVAKAIAAEWDAQREVIDPAVMPLTRLANSIIDGVSDTASAVADDIAKYLGSDLVFYRADGPEGLIERQTQVWDPIVEFARDRLGARFILAQGVVFAAQPLEALDAARAALPADPWRIGALHSVTTLTGSALIGLAMLHGALSADQAWAAAHVDEDWNMEAWGRDEMAMQRRAFRRAEFDAAAKILSAV